MPFPIALLGNHLSGGDSLFDFTTFTEVDPGGYIAITSNTITLNNLFTANSTANVYKDMGDGYYSGDFEFQFSFNIDVIETTGHLPICLLSNTTYDQNIERNILEQDGLNCLVYNNAGTRIFVLEEHFAGTLYQDAYSSLSEDTDYYVTFKRVESVGTYGTIYAYIYSDSARTTLLDTLSVTLHGKVNFRYIHAVVFTNGGVTDRRVWGVVEDMTSPTSTPSGISQAVLTAFSETDSGSKITVYEPVVSLASFATRNTDGWVYKDFGENYFAGNFEFRFKHTISSIAAGGFYTSWMLANTVGDLVDIAADDRLWFRHIDSVGLTIHEKYSGTVYSSSAYVFTTGTVYVKVTRDEAVGTYGTLYAYIYSDPTYETLVDTLSVELHAKSDFRYLFVLAGYNDAGTTGAISGKFGPYLISDSIL